MLAKKAEDEFQYGCFEELSAVKNTAESVKKAKLLNKEYLMKGDKFVKWAKAFAKNCVGKNACNIDISLLNMRSYCRNLLNEREYHSKFLTNVKWKGILEAKYENTLAKDFTKGYKMQPNFNIVIKCSVKNIAIGGVFGSVSKDILSFVVIGTDLIILIMLLIFTDTLNRL